MAYLDNNATDRGTIPGELLTRAEMYLNKIATGNGNIPEVPLTRVEQYLAKIAGEDVTVPDVPFTRIEQYLARIAENGGGGATSMTDVTFNGTLAQPLSAGNYAVLVQQIIDNKACAIISFNFQGTAIAEYLNIDAEQSSLFSNGAQIGSNLSASMAFRLVWSSAGSASTAKAIMSGGVVDLMSMVSQIACTVTIHTLDASAYQ